MDKSTPEQHLVHPQPKDSNQAVEKTARGKWITRILPSGIRERLFLLIALALLPLLVLLGWIIYQRYETRRTNALQTELEVAHGIATTFTTYIEGVQRQNYAVGQAILAALPNQENVTTHLLTITAEQFPALRNLNWVSPEGKVLASSMPDLVGRDLSVRSYFQEIQSGRPWAVGDLIPSGVSSKTPTLAVATAIRDEQGTLRGVVVTAIEPTRLGELVLTQERPASGAYAIFDRQGVIVYSSQKPAITWEERQGWQANDQVLQHVLRTGQEEVGIEDFAAAGGDWVTARVPIPSIGWVAGARRPVAVAIAPVQRSLQMDGLIALVVGLMAFLLASLLARTIAGPLHRLDRDALAMGSGRIVTHVDLQSPGEVTHLRSTVERMAADLIQRADALQESKEWFRTTLSSIGDAVITCDSQARVTFLNPIAEGLTGWTSAEALGQPLEAVFNIINEQTGLAAENPVGKVLQHGLVIGLANHTALIARDGRVTPIEDSAAPIRDAAGQMVGVVMVFHDVTEQRKASLALRESREMLERAQQLAHLGSWELDLVQNRLAWSDEVFRIFGLQPQEFGATYEAFLERVHPDDRVAVDAAYSGSISENRNSYEIEHRVIRALTGEIRFVHEKCEHFRDANGRIIRSVGMVHDITERKLAEEALREAHHYAAWMARFPEENPNPVARVSAEGVILYRNTRAGELPGWMFKEGQPLSAPLLALVERAMEQAAEVQADLLMAGQVYTISVMPFPGEHYANLYGRDVTERKRAEALLNERNEALQKSEERFRTSVESMVDGFAIFSAIREQGKIVDFRIEYINEAGCRMNHRSFAEQVGHTLLELVPEQKELMFDTYVRVVETGEPITIDGMEYEELPGNGQPTHRIFDYQLTRLGDGFASTWRDVTERVKTREELRSSAEKLKRSNQELEQFAFVASHDLQEPLRKIRVFADSVLRRLGQDNPEETKDYLHRMQNAAERMQAMIDGLLDLSRVSTRGGTFTQIHLTQVAEDALLDLEARVQATGGQVTIGKLPIIEADSMQIRQLFQNLIGNALKFHKPDVPPVICISGTRTHGTTAHASRITIRIEDNGIGFNEKYAERIFQPFQRLHGRSEYEGTGLGLAICKKIVERHHGMIEVHSEPGEGSTFTIHLPAKQIS